MRPIFVWDLDGNLIDSVHSRAGCPEDFADVLKEAYDLSEQQYQQALNYYTGPGCGVRVEVQYPTCLDLLCLPKDRVDEFVQEYLERIYSTVYPLYPDAVPCFEDLQGRGFDQHCISTSMKSEFTFSDGREKDHLTETVRTNGLDRFIQYWFGGTRQQENKFYHKGPIMEAFGVGEDLFREASCLIGDAENDMRTALLWGVSLPVYVNRRGFSMGQIEKGLEEKEADPRKVVIVSSLQAVPDVVHNRFRI